MDALVIPPAIADRLLAYLDVPIERMAFLLATANLDEDDEAESWTAVDELYLVDDLDYAYQAVHGMDLADEVRPRVLTWATRPDVALVEVHSHGPLSSETRFSGTDLDGLVDEVVPQLLWRLRGRPYTAIVLGGDDLDALTWARRGEPPTVPAAVVLGDRTLTPTGLSLDVLTREGAR